MLLDHENVTSERRRVKVLYVEDDDVDARVMEMFAELVEDLEVRLTRVRKTSEALLALEHDRYDVCLLDFWLERGSTYRLLCELEQSRSDMGTIVLSNISTVEVDNMRLASGRSQFLSKASCSPDRLASALCAAISQKTN